MLANVIKDDFSRMVVGFVFDEGFNNVLLIQKQKPDWQRGYFNGIGGKCKQDEPPRLAIARETYEETTMDIEPASWTHFVTLRTGSKPEPSPDVEVCFFFTVVERCVLTSAHSETKEQLLIILRSNLQHYKTLPNLQWMIPLAAKWNEGLLPYHYARAIEVFEERNLS